MSLPLPGPPLCLSTHPTHPLILSGHHGSLLHFPSHTCQDPITLFTDPSVSFRDIATSERVAFAACNDGLLRGFDLETGKSEKGMVKAECGLSAVKSWGKVVVVGDDEGGVRIIDTRVSFDVPVLVIVEEQEEKDVGNTCREYVRGVLEQADYISGFVWREEKKLFAAAGDGTVCLYDVRGTQSRLCLASVSECVEDDLLCVESINNGRRIVCGGISGGMQLFTAESFVASHEKTLEEDHVVKFNGHTGSVSCVKEVAGGNGRVVTGCEDGKVRVVNLGVRQSDRRCVERVVATFEDEIECMAWVGGQNALLAVGCADERIHFVKMEDREEEGEEKGGKREKEGEPESEAEESESDTDKKKRRRKKRRKKKGMDGDSNASAQAKSDFFGGL